MLRTDQELLLRRATVAKATIAKATAAVAQSLLLEAVACLPTTAEHASRCPPTHRLPSHDCLQLILEWLQPISTPSPSLKDQPKRGASGSGQPIAATNRARPSAHASIFLCIMQYMPWIYIAPCVYTYRESSVSDLMDSISFLYTVYRWPLWFTQ